MGAPLIQMYRIWFCLENYVFDAGFCFAEQTAVISLNWDKTFCAFCQNENSGEVKDGTVAMLLQWM